MKSQLILFKKNIKFLKWQSVHISFNKLKIVHFLDDFLPSTNLSTGIRSHSDGLLRHNLCLISNVQFDFENEKSGVKLTL